MAFFITIAAYVGALFAFRPAPDSLKAAPLGYFESFARVKATASLGVLLCIVFLLTSGLTFDVSNEKALRILAVSPFSFGHWFGAFQAVAHIFVHYDLGHLISNIAPLAVLSLYERRVGAKRFLAVFLVSGIASAPSIYLYDVPIQAVGASSGISGLVAAYVTDYPKVSSKELAGGLVILVMVMVWMHFPFGEPDDALYVVNYGAHILGALGGFLYCRVVSLRPPPAVSEHATGRA